VPRALRRSESFLLRLVAAEVASGTGRRSPAMAGRILTTPPHLLKTKRPEGCRPKSGGVHSPRYGPRGRVSRSLFRRGRRGMVTDNIPTGIAIGN